MLLPNTAGVKAALQESSNNLLRSQCTLEDHETRPRYQHRLRPDRAADTMETRTRPASEVRRSVLYSDLPQISSIRSL